MSQRDSEFWTKARRARDRLIDQFIDHPDVSGIDVGYPPGSEEKTEIVVRIHVLERWTKARPDERVAFPEEIDGIRVVVMPGKEHRLDTDASELEED